jgi:transcriptional regulator GlxA family with amidase domain
MDMALAFIGSLYGTDTAVSVAKRIEYSWHQDPTADPFAVLHGLRPS